MSPKLKRYLKILLTAFLPLLYVLIKESFEDFPLDSETFLAFGTWLFTVIMNIKIEQTFKKNSS